MSIFSFSLELCIAADYMHPGYQMDDIIYTLSCMRATRKRVVIEPIYLPTLSGPTSGETLSEEASEWQRQAKRWSIGAAEVFHYFVESLIEGRFEAYSGLGYCAWYTWYYALILCGGPLFGLLSCTCFHGRVINHVLMAWRNLETETQHSEEQSGGLLSSIVLGCVVGQYLLFALAHVMDAWFTHLTRHSSKEPPISLARRLLHWLATGPTLLCYSLVSFYGVLEIALCGKAVCTHDPSKKDCLSSLLASSSSASSSREGLADSVTCLDKCLGESDSGSGSEDGGSLDGSSEDGSEGD
jgi:hypothetical protein